MSGNLKRVWYKALACFGVLNTPAVKERALKAAEAKSTILIQYGIPSEVNGTPCISSASSDSHGASIPRAVQGATNPAQQVNIQGYQYLDKCEPFDDLCNGIVGQAPGQEQDNESGLHETELFMNSLISDMKAIACAVSTLDTALSMDPLLLSSYSASKVETPSSVFLGCYATGRSVHGKSVVCRLKAEDPSTPRCNLNQPQKLFNHCRDMDLACALCHPSCVIIASQSEPFLTTAPASSSVMAASAISGEVRLIPNPEASSILATTSSGPADATECQLNVIQTYDVEVMPDALPCALPSLPPYDTVAMGGPHIGETSKPGATQIEKPGDPDQDSLPLPNVVHSLMNLLADVRDLSCTHPPGGVWLGTWRGMRVAVKVFCPPGRPQPDSPQLLTAVRTSRLCHRNLAKVYDVRVCQVDERTLSELDPPPVLRQGWARTPRPVGRLQRFLAAHSNMPLEPLQRRNSSDVALTVLPGDVLLHPQPPATLDRQLLLSLRPRLGECVVAVIMEYCDMENLLNMSIATDSPFCASRSWPLHVARRALLRTAREVATGLAALHAAGVTHGSMHPANVLCCRTPNDRRGFVARLTDAGWRGLRASGLTDSLGSDGLRMVTLAPEALVEGSGGDSHDGGGAALDVYAFGMLLYVMATGQVPFQDQHLGTVLQAVVSEGLQPEWPPGHHDHLEALFLRCVAQCPGERPTAKQILADICALEETIKSSKPKRLMMAAAAASAVSPPNAN